MLKVTGERQPDGYYHLLAAVLHQAWKDAQGRNARHRAAALAWLYSSGAEMVCDWLGLDVDALRERAET